ncbi:hypothetical protein ACC690_37690, partial [Rhizobium johnstonii]
LLTGIHRKDVNRLRGQVLAASFLTTCVSQTSRILARWLADPFYCDSEDRPSALPRTSSDGGLSFVRLRLGCGVCLKIGLALLGHEIEPGDP